MCLLSDLHSGRAARRVTALAAPATNLRWLARLVPVAILILALSPPSALAAESETSNIRLLRCLDEIDLVTRRHNTEATEGTEKHLKELLHSCSHVPQLHHNLGVLAANRQEWNDAITHFEHSLALDERAAMTQGSLASIYQYKASRAYKKALNLREKLKPPVLSMQTSALTNLCIAEHPQTMSQPDTIIAASLNLSAPVIVASDSSSLATSPDAQPDLAQRQDAVRYDVYSWWTAIQEQDDAALPAHYSNQDMIKSSFTERVAFPWNSLSVDIEFIDSIALVSITYPGDPEATTDAVSSSQSTSPKKHDLLLVMKEYDHMWKIVREE